MNISKVFSKREHSYFRNWGKRTNLRLPSGYIKQQKSIMVFMLAFGLIGGALLIKSFAASNVQDIESENGTVSGEAAAIVDSTASSSNAVLFGVTGKSYYVAVNGSANGDGSLNNPWSLEKALSQPAGVVPGDTINLRGGLYKGAYKSALAGSAGKPITVRSYPGEWAKIDAYFTTTLNAALNATSCLLPLADYSGINPGGGIWLENEYIQINAMNGDTITDCYRGWNGTTAVSHTSGAFMYTQNDGLTIEGQDAIYRDFEVYNSTPLRYFDTDVLETGIKGDRNTGINQKGPRTKIVNLLVHDFLIGIGSWESSVDSEIYNVLSYNNGIVHAPRSTGYSLYIQNNTGTKNVNQLISFNNYNLGTHVYGQQGQILGINFKNYIGFNNGAPSSAPGNFHNFTPDYREANFFVGGFLPADRINFTDGHLYMPAGSSVGANMRVGYVASNNSVSITGSTLTSNYNLGLLDWQTATVTGNTMYTRTPTNTNLAEALAAVQTAPAPSNYTWDNNTYYDESRLNNCNGPSARIPFSYTNMFSTCSAGPGPPGSFTDWKTYTGFDAHSTYTANKPTGTKTYSYPNIYQPGRGTLVVYNWDKANTITADISNLGLANGATYTLRNALNYNEKITGTYNGSPITIPMTTWTAVKPIGGETIPNSTLTTFPEFGVFIVLPAGAPAP